MILYPNNTALQADPASYAEVAKRVGSVPVMISFGHSRPLTSAIERACELAAANGLPIVAAVAPPVSIGRDLLRDHSLWRSYWRAVVDAAVEVTDDGATIAAVLVDQECWDVRRQNRVDVAGRTNQLGYMLMATLDCPVWFYRLGDQQSYHFSTYGTPGVGEVLEGPHFPVSARCYEPTLNNGLDIDRVASDPRYRTRPLGAWFSSPSGCGYLNGRWSSDATKFIERAKSDGELVSRLQSEQILQQTIVYPHPLTPGEGRMQCFETFLTCLGM